MGWWSIWSLKILEKQELLHSITNHKAYRLVCITDDEPRIRSFLGSTDQIKGDGDMKYFAFPLSWLRAVWQWTSMCLKQSLFSTKQ